MAARLSALRAGRPLSPKAIVRLEGLGKLKKKSNDLIGTRTSDLPTCSMVPQPTALPRNILLFKIKYISGNKITACN
jgi:hypothetical protein